LFQNTDWKWIEKGGSESVTSAAVKQSVCRRQNKFLVEVQPLMKAETTIEGFKKIAKKRQKSQGR
jgi:hypothetical protein